MKIKVKPNLQHNRFDIKVKDITLAQLIQILKILQSE